MQLSPEFGSPRRGIFYCAVYESVDISAHYPLDLRLDDVSLFFLSCRMPNEWVLDEPVQASHC